MILYILIIIIPRWIGYPGYVPSVFTTRNASVAWNEWVFQVTHGNIVTMQKQIN